MSSPFPDTRISLFERLHSPSAQESADALEEFVTLYWYPLYAHIRSRGNTHDKSSDLLQSFIEKQMLERQALSRWDSTKGRLRSFLLSCVDNFLKNDYRRENAGKRGGGLQRVELDFEGARESYEAMGTASVSPDRQLDRAWAAATVSQATALLAERYREKGKSEEFLLLLTNLEYRGSSQENPAKFSKIAAQLGTSDNAVAQRMRSFRREFKLCIRSIVRNTVAEDEIGDEVQFLLSLLGN